MSHPPSHRSGIAPGGVWSLSTAGRCPILDRHHRAGGSACIYLRSACGAEESDHRRLLASSLELRFVTFLRYHVWGFRLRWNIEQPPEAGRLPFDLMVDDIEAARRDYADRKSPWALSAAAASTTVSM